MVAGQSDRPLPEHKALPVQPLGDIGTWQGDRRAARAVPAKPWSRTAADAAAPPESREPWRDGGAHPAPLDEDHPLKRIPREAIEFLRDNRHWLFGLVGAIAVLAVLLKLYSRRI